jgi:thymidylate synthase
MELINRRCTDVWIEALRLVRTQGREFTDERGNLCAETLNLTLSIIDPTTTREPLEIMQKRKTWHYPSAEDLERMITEPRKGSFPYTYGNRIHAYRGAIDQLNSYVIPLLRTTPWSRRAIMSIWDPEDDADPSERTVPGHIAIDFKLRDGKLHATSMMRSADIFFGFPANVFQISVLLEHASRILRTKPGTITAFCTSAHLFEYQYSDIDELFEEIQTKP